MKNLALLRVGYVGSIGTRKISLLECWVEGLTSQVDSLGAFVSLLFDGYGCWRLLCTGRRDD